MQYVIILCTQYQVYFLDINKRWQNIDMQLACCLSQ